MVAPPAGLNRQAVDGGLSLPLGLANIIEIWPSKATASSRKASDQDVSPAPRGLDKAIMVEYARKAITSIELVVRIEQVEVRRLQFEFEDALKSIFPTGSKSLDNAPRPPGPVPRWMMVDGDKLLIATDQSLSLALNFQHNRPQHGAIAVAEKYAQSLDAAVGRIIEREKRIFAGVVMTVNLSSYGANERELSQRVAEIMLSTKIPLSRVVSSAASIAYVGSGGFEAFNFGYTVNPYKLVNVQLPAQATNFAMQMQPIDAETLPAQELGISIRIDVNDRNTEGQDIGAVRLARPDHGSLASLIPACRAACDLELKNLLADPTLEVEGI